MIAPLTPAFGPVDPETLPELLECAHCETTHDASELHASSRLCDDCRGELLGQLKSARRRVGSLERLLFVPGRTSFGELLDAISKAVSTKPVTTKFLSNFAHSTAPLAPELLDALAGFLRVHADEVEALALEEALERMTNRDAPRWGLGLRRGTNVFSGRREARTYRVVVIAAQGTQ